MPMNLQGSKATYCTALAQVKKTLLPASPVLAAVLALALLGVGAQLEVFRSLDRLHALGLALCALEFKYDLLGGLGLLVEDRLRLAAKAGLLLVVPALALGAE